MSATKKGDNTTDILNCCFFAVNLHFVTSNQISTYRKLDLSLTNSVYLVFLPLETQKGLEQTKVSTRFFTLKRNDPKTFKTGSCKNLFLQRVWCWYKLLRWMYFVLCDNRKTLLFLKVYCYSEIFLTAMLLLFFKKVFWKKCVLYAFSTLIVWC